MVKKAIILLGSPRKDSNTHILAKEAARGLAACGAESEFVFLNDLNIKGCQSCGHCKINNTTDCTVKDDMQKIRKAMEASDGIILASPVYYGTVTAQVKTWGDRLYPYLGPGHNLPGHKMAAFIFTQNQPDENLFRSNLNWYMSMVKLAGFETGECLVAGNLAKGFKPMVTENPRYMKAAYDLGKSLFA